MDRQSIKLLDSMVGGNFDPASRQTLDGSKPKKKRPKQPRRQHDGESDGGGASVSALLAAADPQRIAASRSAPALLATRPKGGKPRAAVLDVDSEPSATECSS